MLTTPTMLTTRTTVIKPTLDASRRTRQVLCYMRQTYASERYTNLHE